MEQTNGVGAHETQPVFRLIYRSESRVPSDQRRVELGDVFTTSRRNNKRLGVTGALMVSDDSFVQTLEGDEPVVRDLYARIAEDARHEQVTLLKEEFVGERTFGRWAMAKVSEDGGSDIRLLSNAQKGAIVAVPGADPAITAEQEAVLASMRDWLAAES
jgi:hypothetical protein